MYQRLTYIGPISFGLVYGVLTALMFLLLGLIALIFGPMTMVPAEMQTMPGMDPAMMTGGGVLGVLFSTVIGFVMGLVFGILGAVLFNITATITGGFKLRFEPAGNDDI